ncbi:hemin uptake protein HemP [Kordiimonas sp. SCSIO 12610]|uniref:hemin uptake protein HemP n=1 Tax=Kordiimonas sp. SCSIO 12610 TaxID=2829597 RepID=UPI00210BCDBC|nr:hemin uptake protein HemP [Kordiimonas sp. SCSIO 12610]UTW55671.1 hemin uptake protein HemP [Kordiimonas sp. SCSIO 12610]
MQARPTLSVKPSAKAYVPHKPIVSSDTILQGQTEVIIMHEDVEYRLRRTSQNKLILTK